MEMPYSLSLRERGKPEVYKIRDEELAAERPSAGVYKTLEEAKQGLVKFIQAPQSGMYNWAVVVLDNNEYKLYPRRNQPCFGEMRVYTMPEYRPGDLHSPFPDGTPYLFGFPIHEGASKGCTWLLTDVHTPYKRLADKWEPVKNKAGKYIKGFILTDTKVSSDLLFDAVRATQFIVEDGSNKLLSEKDLDVRFAKYILKGLGKLSPEGTSLIITNKTAAEGKSLSRLISGTPDVDYTEEGTFFNRFPYRRKYTDMFWYKSVTEFAEDNLLALMKYKAKASVYYITLDGLFLEKVVELIKNERK